jgi:secreted PhoX family phosphatase
MTSRRTVLKVGLATFVSGLPVWGCAMREASRPRLGFTAVPVSSEDRLVVPPGYRADVIYRWGDPVGAAQGMPEFRFDASNSAAEQALQAGMHHDAIEFFPLSPGAGLLAMNHEYTDEYLLHGEGARARSAERVRKSQAAHGVSVVEVRSTPAGWQVARPSKYARRITAYTPMRISGPAAGHALLGTGPVLGTFSNCAGGRTPWGTYLACEENFHGYYVQRGAISAEARRYGISARGFGYRWEQFDARFDATDNPYEPNKHGWVVEIDPYDPQSVPVKRTALGRFKHEGAMVTLARDGRVVVYMGDDEGFEYIYKFVSSRPYDGRSRDLLDAGRLYAARFDAGGAGRWLPLPETPEAVVYARIAADRAGATRMDRPEWIAVHPETRDVYASLTNNSQRGAEGMPGADPANPRARNLFGHILRWRELGGDPAAETFRWDIFALGGEEKGFGSPDGLSFDASGLLWIQTDVSPRALHRGPYAKFGNNQMLAADVSTGEIRRFLTGPPGCEVTGMTQSPDGRTMFVNIQHPGEAAADQRKPDDPRAVSNWPDYRSDGRPRSATIAIRRDDGGVIGS